MPWRTRALFIRRHREVNEKRIRTPDKVALLKGWADGRGGADTVHSARILRNWQVRLAVAL